MSAQNPQMILHIGAPKCASSTVQTALSTSPDLTATDGTLYRYCTISSRAGWWHVHYGKDVPKRALASPYGYDSWPYLGIFPKPHAQYFNQMFNTLQLGRQKNHIPILSNEGWINHPETFAKSLKEWGYPPVELIAFLRPVVDWVNACFWQWGVWNTPNLDQWMARSNMSYSFADDLEKWAAIPNVKLTVFGLEKNVLHNLSNHLNVTLTEVKNSNASSSAPLIGVLLRNREFRSSGHNSAIEFIVQRWCPPLDIRKPWALAPRHIHALRSVRDQALLKLSTILPPSDFQNLTAQEGWSKEAQYHPDLKQGVSKIHDPGYFPDLYMSLAQGIKKAGKHADLAICELPSAPATSATVEEWDRVFCHLLKILLNCDDTIRKAARPLAV